MFTEKELKFSIYLIHNLAENWNRTPAAVYGILNDTRILDGRFARLFGGVGRQ